MMRARRKAFAAPSARDWSFRHELKYYINQGEAALLENTLALTMDRDPYAGPDGSYFIRSLYFDDVASSALRQKLQQGARPLQLEMSERALRSPRLIARRIMLFFRFCRS